jgi:hypothetical protein
MYTFVGRKSKSSVIQNEGTNESIELLDSHRSGLLQEGRPPLSVNPYLIYQNAHQMSQKHLVLPRKGHQKECGNATPKYI